jgi:predicted  nucleic acid-binding Zn-ribbon protein
MADLTTKVKALQAERDGLQKRVLEINVLSKELRGQISQMSDELIEKQERLDKLDSIFAEIGETDEMKAITDEKVGG